MGKNQVKVTKLLLDYTTLSGQYDGGMEYLMIDVI